MLYVTLRHNLVPRRRKRRAIGHPGTPPSHMAAPNEVWSADFKGHFKTGDGRYGYPLTITDNNSRFLLGCEALSSTRVQEAKPVFTRVFKELACRSASAPTTVCRSPPTPSPGCPNCP
jgi:putative transposase